jgi:predicted transcriptional regulator
MAREPQFGKILKVKISDDQKDKLEALAEEAGMDKSQIIRDQIDSLPDIRKKNKAGQMQN